VSKKPVTPVPPGHKEIFRKYYFNKYLGRRIYAWEKGLKAFRFIVKA